MVSPALGTTHGLRDLHILPIPLPDDYIIDEVPMFGARVHPRCPVAGRKAEDGVSDE